MDPLRFRVEILNGGIAIRTFEVEGETAIYPDVQAGMDFPDDFDNAEVAVAQWSDSYGWGVRARTALT